MNAAKRVALLMVSAAAVLAIAAAEQAQAQAQAPVQAEQPGSPLLRSADVQQDRNARLDELTGNEVTGVLLAALAVFVAAGGGTGGGGVLDPIYILIMGLDPKMAIPLSSITIVGGAIANFAINVQRTQKNSTEPLIDWDFILMMQPMLLLGAGVGTFLNRVIPTSMLCVLLVIILSITGVRTLQKAIHARRKERWLCCTRPQEATTLLGASSSTASGIQIIQTTSVKTVPTDEQQRAAIPWPKIGALFGLFFGIMLLNILRGTSKFPSPLGVSPSSTLSPLLSALPFAFLGVISYLSWKNVTKAYAKQQEPDYELSPHEIKWTSQSLWYFPLFSVSAGTISGMFGIGGGIINGPLLLELGVDPAAASAMTATTVLFSSGMSASQYALAGSVEPFFAAILFPMGFVMTYIGHACLMKVIQRFNCPSMIVFSMAIVVLVSAVAMTVESVRSLLE